MIGTAYKIAANPAKRVRYGLWKCRECRNQFTCKVGTVFEHARIPLHKALRYRLLICSVRRRKAFRAINSLALWKLASRPLGSFRIACAKQCVNCSSLISLGEGKIVEADETYVGGKERNKHRSKRRAENIGGVVKQVVFALVERGGKVRSMHLPSVSAANLRPVLKAQIDAEKTRLMTDGEGQYSLVAEMFKSHDVVNHGVGEYVRGDAHTNTIEGYFSLLKRCIIGVYHRVNPQHLKRYVAEFDFCYNHRVALGVDDFDRTLSAFLGGAV